MRLHCGHESSPQSHSIVAFPGWPKNPLPLPASPPTVVLKKGEAKGSPDSKIRSCLCFWSKGFRIWSHLVVGGTLGCLAAAACSIPCFPTFPQRFLIRSFLTLGSTGSFVLVDPFDGTIFDFDPFWDSDCSEANKLMECWICDMSKCWDGWDFSNPETICWCIIVSGWRWDDIWPCRLEDRRCPDWWLSTSDDTWIPVWAVDRLINIIASMKGLIL